MTSSYLKLSTIKRAISLGLLSVTMISQPQFAYAAESNPNQQTQDIVVTADATEQGEFEIQVPTKVSMSLKNSKEPIKWPLQWHASVTKNTLPDSKRIDLSIPRTLSIHREGTEEDYELTGGRSAHNYFIGGQTQSGFMGDMWYTVPELRAGKYTTVIPVNISISEHGAKLTVSDMKERIASDSNITELIIPSRVDDVLIQSVDLAGISVAYPNLQKIVFPDNKELTVLRKSSGKGQDAFYYDHPVTFDFNNGSPILNDLYLSSDVVFENAGPYLKIEGRLYNNYVLKPDGSTEIAPEYRDGPYYLSDHYNHLKDVVIDENTYFDSYDPSFVDKCDTLTVKYSASKNIKQIRWSGNGPKKLYYDLPYVTRNAFSADMLKRSRLEEVVLGEHVRYIDAEAFAGCRNLRSVTLPDHLDYVSPSAFTDTAYLDDLISASNGEDVNIGGHLAHRTYTCEGDVFRYPYDELTVDNGTWTISPDIVPAEAKTLVLENGNNSYVSLRGVFHGITKVDFSKLTGGFAVSSGSGMKFLRDTFPDATEFVVNQLAIQYLTNTSGHDYVFGDQQMILGEDVNELYDFVFCHYTAYNGSSYVIPKNVEKIGSGVGAHTFYNMGKDGVFKEFIVEEGNTHFETDNGILYTKGKERLVSIPRAAEFENNTFVMPDETKYIGELSFSRNKNINTLVIGDSYQFIPDINEQTIKETLYPAALNSGNSLSVSTYAYVPIKRYETKDTNPNYTAIDGLLYTKDKKTLLAVPHFYEGEIRIVDGCENIAPNAFWLDNGNTPVYTGVSKVVFPDSMKNIDTRQAEFIKNRWGESTKPIMELSVGETKAVETSVKFAQSYWVGKEEIPALHAETWNHRVSYEPFVLKPGRYKMIADYSSLWSTGKIAVIGVTAAGARYLCDTDKSSIITISEDTVIYVLVEKLPNSDAGVITQSEIERLNELSVQFTRLPDINGVSSTQDPQNGVTYTVDTNLLVNYNRWADATSVHAEGWNKAFSYQEFTVPSGTYTLNSDATMLFEDYIFKVFVKDSTGVRKLQPANAKQYTETFNEPTTVYITFTPKEGGQEVPVSDEAKARLDEVVVTITKTN